MTTENNVVDISKYLNEARKNEDRQPAIGTFAKSGCNRLSAKVRQYDFFINDQDSGSDEDGDRMFYVDTDNLMIGTDVRVLIKTDTAHEDVFTAMLKISQ